MSGFGAIPLPSMKDHNSNKINICKIRKYLPLLYLGDPLQKQQLKNKYNDFFRFDDMNLSAIYYDSKSNMFCRRLIVK